MLLKVLDGTGVLQTVVVASQEAVADASGAIATTAVSQVVTAASSLRSGFFFQNNGTHTMWLSELGSAVAGSGSISVAPGATLPAGYPVSTGAWNVLGTAGDAFTARIW